MRKLLVCMLAGLLHVCAAQADPIQFTFAGVINNDPFGVFGGATFTGSFTFDSAMTQVLNTPQSGGYAGSGGIFNMTVSFAGALDPAVNGPYVADTLNITVNNDFPGPLDQFLVTGTSSTDSMLFILLTFQDFTGTAFNSTALPLVPPSLLGFTSLQFTLFDGTLDNPVEGAGSVTSLVCAAGCAVPEPPTLLLLLGALGALALFGRRPSRSRRRA